MKDLPATISPERWLTHLFSARSAAEGGTVRRKVIDVERLIGRERFLHEVHRRGFGSSKTPVSSSSSATASRSTCCADGAASPKSFRKDLQNPSKDFVHTRPLRYGLGMTARPVKHSLTLHGHRTSVSLEDAFWLAFREIAAIRGQPLNDLAAEIDAARQSDEGLASAIRVFVLNHYRATAVNATARSP